MEIQGGVKYPWAHGLFEASWSLRITLQMLPYKSGMETWRSVMFILWEGQLSPHCSGGSASIFSQYLKNR